MLLFRSPKEKGFRFRFNSGNEQKRKEQEKLRHSQEGGSWLWREFQWDDDRRFRRYSVAERHQEFGMCDFIFWQGRRARTGGVQAICDKEEDYADTTGNDEEAICGKEKPSQTKARSKDNHNDTTDKDVSKAIAALFGNDKQTKDKGGEKSDGSDSTDNEAISALFGKEKPSQAKGKTKKADENDSTTIYEGTRSGKEETVSEVNALPLLNKDDVETPSKGGSRMISITWCQPVDKSSNMDKEKQTELTPHESKTLFRLKQGRKMKATCGKDLDKKAAVVGSKVNVKVDKRDVTGAQGVHGVAFEIGTGGGC
jgi:hypothetical protein